MRAFALLGSPRRTAMAIIPCMHTLSSVAFSCFLPRESPAAFRPIPLLALTVPPPTSSSLGSPVPAPPKPTLRPFPPSLVAYRAASTGAGTTAIPSDNREILIQHLLLKEDQLPLLLDLERKLLQEDADLSDLATEYSTCPSKKDGGMLGWVRNGQMVPEFEEAAFSAPLNKIVRVKTKFGWHLLQALSEREGSFLTDIQPEELHIRLQDASFTEESQLIDVREPQEISMAAIKGFKPYPLSQFGQWAPTITSDLDPSKDTYVLCHHGVRSMQAAQWLTTQGFRRIYNVAGGIHQYSLKADRSIPVY